MRRGQGARGEDHLAARGRPVRSPDSRAATSTPVTRLPSVRSRVTTASASSRRPCAQQRADHGRGEIVLGADRAGEAVAGAAGLAHAAAVRGDSG